MNTKHIAILCLITTTIGILFYCFMHELIIIRMPYSRTVIDQARLTPKQTMPVILYTWHNHRWHKETDSIVKPAQKDEQVKGIINRWLDLLHEEQHIPVNVTLQSVLLSHDATTAYVSFTTTPFNPNAATIDALFFIKSMLRTLYENNAPIKEVFIMENHLPLTHSQLDFTHAWPLHSLDHIS